jgi:hypothetical protein
MATVILTSLKSEFFLDSVIGRFRGGMNPADRKMAVQSQESLPGPP